MEQYELIEKQIEKAWASVDRIRERNADRDPEEVIRDITAVVEKVWREMEEAERRAGKRRL